MLSGLLGQSLYVFSSSSLMQSDHISNIILGMVQGCFFVLLQNIECLQPAMLISLSSTIQNEKHKVLRRGNLDVCRFNLCLTFKNQEKFKFQK